MPVTWEEATIAVPEAEFTPEDGEDNDRRDRSDDDEAITQFVDAEAVRSVIILYVYCGSEDDKYQKHLEACSEFENDVLNTHDVTTAMQGTINLRLNGVDLERDIRSEYKISKNRFPQLLIYAFNGKKLTSIGSGANPRVVAETIEAAKKYCEELAAKMDG